MRHLTIALLLVPSTASCASALPDPLMASRATADALGQALTARSHELDEELFVAVLAKASTCPETPPEQAACRHDAFVAASLAQAKRRADQGFLVLLQRGAADALDAAVQCKSEACLDKAKVEVERAVAEIRAMLLRGDR